MDSILCWFALILAAGSLWMGLENRGAADDIRSYQDEIDKYTVILDEEVTGVYACAYKIVNNDGYSHELFAQCLVDWSEQDARSGYPNS